MVFVVDDPPAAEDNITAANTIHTYIQEAKEAIGERLEANNGDFLGHQDITDLDNAGKHEPSRIGFVKVHNDLLDVTTMSPKEGTLHYVRGTTVPSEKGIYTIDTEGNPIRSGILNHALLEGLDDDSCHTIYLLKDGTRAMTADLDLGSGANPVNGTYGAADSSPLEEAHVDKTWFEAHGAGSVNAGLFSGGKVGSNHLRISQTYNSETAENRDIGTVGIPCSFRFGEFVTTEFEFFPYAHIETVAYSNLSNKKEYPYPIVVYHKDASSVGDCLVGYYAEGEGPAFPTGEVIIQLQAWVNIVPALSEIP